ncbi:universal stress protein [uncultured Dokdonia sp.]|uniref:universal stress protein n=2 Tax=Dokdonia TaxID=326319 RepID=UPI00262DB3DE|nr:universal stress protein [uncultured Dokdonia sp.]
MLLYIVLMKHILIPVDFSSQSWNTALCAINLYKSPRVRFYLFFSEELDYSTDREATICEPPTQQLTSWIKKLDKVIAGGQTIEPLRWKSDFIGGMRKAVADNHIDLIVMSTSYPNIFCDVLKGSHVREVITRLKCPVLIVPREFHCKSPEQVVLITDYNFNHRAEPTSVINNFIKRTSAHLNILQLSKTGNALSETQQTNKTFLQTSFHDIPHSFHFVMERTMDEALQFFVDVQQVDLVVLFAKNINLSENVLFSPALSEEKDYHKNIPFLIVHE